MLPDEILKFFSSYIEKEIGIVYATHNQFQLLNRLEEISKLLGQPSIEALYAHAQKGIQGDFKQLLLDIATNNETSFFRDPKVFRGIETIVQSLNEEKQRLPSQQLRIWSAASSTGQEALSISIIFNELNALRPKPLEYSILASDICERALEKARKGRYTQLEVQRGLPVQYLVKYFSKDENDHWSIQQHLKKNIDYRKINLKDCVFSHEKFDLILCRNILIYQSIENKVKIVSALSDCLNEGGYLILGSGECMLGISNLYDQQSFNGAIFYKKKKFQPMAA